MNYNDWLDLINQVEKSNRNTIYLQKMEDANNNININEMLQPKLIDLITNKLAKAIRRIVNNINETFRNPNTLELTIINFDKDIQYILKICNLKQIDNDVKSKLITTVNDEANKVYDILIEKSLEADRTGMYKTIIEKKKNSKR